MKRSTKIKPVASHARQLEEEAARLFADAQQKVAAAQSQLQQLNEYQQEYLDKWSSANHGRSNILQLRDYQAFLEKIKQGISQANLMVEQAMQQSEYRRQQWLKQRARCQALDKVLETHLVREQKQLDHREQQEMEELSRRLYFNCR